MSHLILLIPLLILLSGIFVFRKMLYGAIGAVLSYILLKWLTSSFPNLILNDIADALIISGELALLISGAFFFFRLQEKTHRFEGLKKAVSIQESRLVIVLLLVWFFGSFIEGVSGFGTPPMLIGPVLLSLGFSPLASIAVPLAANTTAVNFGALATPVKVGLGTLVTPEVVKWIVLINILPALLMPFLLDIVLFRTKDTRQVLKSDIKLLIGAGLCFVIPYSSAIILGVEFGSAMAGGVGLLLFTFLFLRKQEGLNWKLWKSTFWPYALFVVLLIVFKQISEKEFLQFHISGVALRKVYLFQAGLVFFLTGVLYVELIKETHKKTLLRSAFRECLKKVKTPFLVIFFLALFTRLVRYDFAEIVVRNFSGVSPEGLLCFTPLTGIIGSFLTGSATMSNLLLSHPLASVIPYQLFIQPLLIALLHTGGAVGNAISLQNIIMVKSTVGEKISEQKIIGLTGGVVIVYWIILVLVSLITYFTLK